MNLEIVNFSRHRDFQIPTAGQEKNPKWSHLNWKHTDPSQAITDQKCQRGGLDIGRFDYFVLCDIWL